MLDGLRSDERSGDESALATAMTEREKKCWQYLRLPNPIDMLILGSSKGPGNRPENRGSCGYRRINFWVNSSRTEDWYCIGAICDRAQHGVASTHRDLYGH